MKLEISGSDPTVFLNEISGSDPTVLLSRVTLNLKSEIPNN